MRPIATQYLTAWISEIFVKCMSVEVFFDHCINWIRAACSRPANECVHDTDLGCDGDKTVRLATQTAFPNRMSAHENDHPFGHQPEFVPDVGMVANPGSKITNKYKYGRCEKFSSKIEHALKRRLVMRWWSAGRDVSRLILSLANPSTNLRLLAAMIQVCQRLA